MIIWNAICYLCDGVNWASITIYIIFWLAVIALLLILILELNMAIRNKLERAK